MAPRVFSEAIKLLLYISIFTTLSTCSPITPRTKRHTLDDISPNRKRQDGLFSVLGVAGPDSHPRLEIRELEKNEDQWNVYLLGLQRFQSVDQSDKLSYYQISGTFIRVLHFLPLDSRILSEFDFLDLLVA
jgi:tyrosinase